MKSSEIIELYTLSLLLPNTALSFFWKFDDKFPSRGDVVVCSDACPTNKANKAVRKIWEVLILYCFLLRENLKN